MNSLLARYRLRRDDALMARLVRQPRRSGDVADRPDALDICAAIGMGIDMALGRFDAELFQPDILGVGQDADRNDRVAEIMARALAVARLDARADSLGGRRQLLDTRARQDRHLLLGDRLGPEVQDLRTLDRTDPITPPPDSHPGP